MESKHWARARCGIEIVGEAGLDTGGLVGKRQRVLPTGESFRQSLCVFIRLNLDTGQCRTLFLGFDDASGLTIDIQKIIGEAVAG